MKIQKAYEEFIYYKKSYCASRTVEYYEYTLNLFMKWLQREKDIDADAEVALLDKSILIQYVYHCNTSGISRNSVWNYIIGVKTFYKWLHSEEFLKKDYTQNLKLPKMTRKNIIPLTVNEVIAIDECFPETFLGKRNKLLFYMMLDCGMRSQEVIHLRNHDINMIEKYISIRKTKGGKNRVIPLPDKIKKLILNYQEELNPCKISDYTFLNRYKHDPMSLNSLKQLMQKLKKQSAVPRLHAHLLRHTFATSYIMGGGNLEMLRILLGHSDYNVTKNYLHIAAQNQLMNYDIYKLDEIYFQNYRNYHKE